MQTVVPEQNITAEGAKVFALTRTRSDKSLQYCEKIFFLTPSIWEKVLCAAAIGLVLTALVWVEL